MEFRDRLKLLRKSKNLSQKELGAVLSYNHSTIASYESGRNRPSYEDLIEIARHFKVSTDYLLGVTDDPRPASDVVLDLDEQRLFRAMRVLDAQRKEELFVLLEWLEENQDEEEEFPSALLRMVAQSNAAYTVKEMTEDFEFWEEDDDE